MIPKVSSIVGSLSGEDNSSGDYIFTRQEEDITFFAVVDMAGHGPSAHEASLVCERFLNKNYKSNLVKLVYSLDECFRKIPREGVAVLGQINHQNNECSYVGVGNIAIRKFGNSSLRILPREGIIGLAVPSSLKIERFTCHSGDVLVLYSDGIRNHFQDEDCPWVLTDPAKSIAQKIIKNFSRGTDDASCLVIKFNHE